MTAAELVVPVRDALARLSPRIMIATSALCLVVGALAGWNARDPDVLALPSEAASTAPALWLEPRWTKVPQQKTAEEQLRYALLQAPADEWAPAFLAVAGYFRGANEVVSKAYIQLARIWYREGNLEALGTLESELLQWPQKKEHDKALVDSIRTAILLKKGDLEGAVKGMESLVHDDVPHMFDPGVVELNLEVCSDAMAVATRAGNDTMRATLQPFWTQLMRRLYRIERPGGGRPGGRPNEKNVRKG